MGERFPGKIDIGGKLPRSKIEELLTKVQDSGAGPEYDGGIDYMYQGKHEKLSHEERLVALLEEIKALNATKEPFLTLCHSQAAGGAFEELEDWCGKNGLSYDRHSDAHYEFNAENVFHRPGFDASVASDQDGHDLINAPLVKRARQALDKGNVHEALQALDDALAGLDGIEPLPPLEVVDD